MVETWDIENNEIYVAGYMWLSFICYSWRFRIDKTSIRDCPKLSNAGNLETPTTVTYLKSFQCCYTPTEY